MGHASHEPEFYRNDDDDGADEQEALTRWQQQAEEAPDALPYVPPVLDSDPFPETDDTPPPPQPWDNGRMFGSKAYPTSERQATRRGWRRF